MKVMGIVSIVLFTLHCEMHVDAVDVPAKILRKLLKGSIEG